MIVLLLVVLLITPFLWWYLSLKKFDTLKHIPGPKPLPLIGNALDLGSNPQDLFNNCFKLCKKYGHVYKFHVGNEVKIMVAKPEVLADLLNSNVHIVKSNAYDLIKPWLGIGLLTSAGQKWKIRRRMITPTFHFKILDQFVEIFNSAGNILIKKLSNEVGKESFDIFPFINLYSLDIICETAMGVQIKAQENNNSEYVAAVKGYLDITIVRMFSFWQRYDFLFRFSPSYKTYKNHLKTLHKFTNNVIALKRKKKSQKKIENTARDDGIKRKVALLDMLLESESNEQLTHEDIREEIDTFMFEGHDTTTSGISFTILALANHPEIQERVYQEIQSVVGNDESVTMQHLQDLSYLEMVLKEVQRFYPSVPLVERKLESEYTMGGYTFPKDTTITIYTYGLHYNEDYFSKPEVFDPDRFLPENQVKRHNFAYVPFSAGPRNCIGQKFAVLEMKAAISKIVQNFKILPVANYKPDLGMAGILKSYNGIQVSRLDVRSSDLLKNSFNLCKKYGHLYKLHVGNEVKIMVSKPEVLEDLLNSNVHIVKSHAYDLIKSWLGIGLLTSTGQKWKTRRKMITPTFHFKILDQFVEIFNSASNILIKKLLNEVGKESFDIFPLISLFSLDIICETAMGVQIKAQENNNSEYVAAVKGFLNLFIVRVFSFWQRYDFLFQFSPSYKTYMNHLKTLHKFTNDVIATRRKEKSQKKMENTSREDGIKRKVALLDMLLESESNELLTNEDIREEISTFMLGGHDTTTSAMSFTILALADHPEIQERVYQEIQSVVGNDETITMQHMQDLRYLEMVLKEVQRFYPSVPFVERKLESNFTMGGYTFPKDTTITIYIYGLHYNEDHFPKPEVFDPDRFLPENQVKRHKFAFVPFSAGPRNCIGQKFAMLEMKVAITKIVQNFKILPVANYKPELGMAAVLTSHNGIQVCLKPRS